MKVSIQFFDLTDEEATKLLAFASKLGVKKVKEADDTETDDDDDMVAPAKKPGKKKPDPLDMDEEEESEEEEAEEEKPKAKKGPTHADVITAMKAYAEEHDRKEAMKILAKFTKAKEVHKLTEEQIPKILKMLKV